MKPRRVAGEADAGGGTVDVRLGRVGAGSLR